MKKKGLIVTLIITLILFAVLLFVQKIVFTGGTTKTVIVAKTNVSQDTEITEDNLRDYFALISVDANIVPENALEKKEDILGKSTTCFLSEKEVLTKEDITQSKKTKKDYIEPVRTCFQLSSIANGFAGKLRPGQVVTISFTDKKSDQVAVVEKKALIEKVYTADGVDVVNSDVESSAIILQVIVEEKNMEKLAQAIDAGTIKISQEVEKGSEEVE